MKEYIERASLMGALTSGTEQLDMREMTGAEAYAEFVRLVNFAPAADVVEVRHGRWEKFVTASGIISRVRCSVCAGTQSLKFESMPYCPTCGARMDKEDEHD